MKKARDEGELFLDRYRLTANQMVSVIGASSGSSAWNLLRVAMYSGRGVKPYFGGLSVFVMLLYTMKTLARGHGEILLAEPCMVLQSKNTTEPALAVMDRI